MFRLTTLMFAAAMLAQPAQAGVVYSWKQVQASSTMPVGLNLEMVFSDKAVASGRVALDFVNDCYGGAPCFDPQDSLLSLRYWFEQRDGSGAVREYNLIQFGYREQPRYFGDHISMDISFLDGGMVGGSIRANDGNSNFDMLGADGIFSLLRTDSDEGNPCGLMYPDACGGELGQLRETGRVADVPEPATPLIAGLGLLAAWCARRRRA